MDLKKTVLKKSKINLYIKTIFLISLKFNSYINKNKLIIKSKDINPKISKFNKNQQIVNNFSILYQF